MRSMSEHKYFLTGYSRADTVIADVTPQCLSLVPQGYEDVQRIGDSMTGTSLELRYYIFMPREMSATRFIMTRFIGFIWKEDTVPGIIDVIDISYTGSTSGFRPLLPFNHNKKINRKILWDYSFCNYGDGDSTITNYTANGGNGVAKTGKIVLNLPKLRNNLNKISFDPALVTGRNHIYFMILSTGPGGTVTSNFTLIAKYTFVDN